MRRLHVNGRPIQLDHKIAGGLEAEVFRCVVGGRPVAVKVFLTAEHPSFDPKPNAKELRRAASSRLAEHQRKLPSFPTNLPSAILTPIDLVRDSVTNQIAGYTMELLPGDCEGARLYADHDLRSQKGISNTDVVALLIELHRIIREGHAAGIIFGDALSGNNVQFQFSNGKGQVWIIDADSIETPGFPNWTHTREIVDPNLCRATELVLDQPRSRDADWYAYSVLVAWLLTLAHPYFDGFYLPDDEMNEDERALGGISVFNPDVELPKAAITPDRFPDDLTAYLRLVFEKGQRGEFPVDLLNKLVWTDCSCGKAHGRDLCPSCGTPAAGSKKTRQGSVEATELFAAPDSTTIVSVAAQGGNLYYAYRDGADLHRESGQVITDALTDPAVRVLISGDRTAIHDGSTLTIYAPDGSVAHQANDVAHGTVVGSNSKAVYWLTPDGKVMRTGTDKPRRLGVISGPSPYMWVGERFGVALWRQVVGRVYIFDSEQAGLTGFPLPAVPGNLVDAHCIISSSHAFLLLTLERNGGRYNYCYAIDVAGVILASAEAPHGDGSWLGSGIRTHAATRSSLYTPTPDGIVRVEIDRSSGGAQFAARDPHANSAPFVAGAERLLVGSSGMLSITGTHITQLVNR